MKSVAQQLFDEAFAKARDARSAEYKQGVLDILRHRLCEPNPDFKVGRYIAGTPQADAYWAGNDEGHLLARKYLDRTNGRVKSDSESFSFRGYLVEADATGNIYPNAEAVAFSEAVAAAIKAKLVAGTPKFGLMPYRHNSDYLGFDWIDAEKNSISIVFYTTPNAQPLPTRIDPEGADVGVSSWIDALLLIRMIAERVKGNSVGDV